MGKKSFKNVEILQTNVKLDKKPSSPTQAYRSVIKALSSEIEEKQEVLSELSTEEGKREFIRSWHKDARNVVVNRV